jgi:uncharacterized protein YqgV (UPF0045/DUF77 family)
MIQCQISLYPLGDSDFKKFADTCIETLNHPGISYTIGSMSTHVVGETVQVFRAVENLFELATSKNQNIVMTVTYSSLPLF